MFKNCFRHKIDRPTGQIIVVPEGAGGVGKQSRKSRKDKSKEERSSRFTKPIIIPVLALAGAFALPTVSFAQVVPDSSAAPTNQSTILLAPNDVPLINIQTPSSSGLSHNIYSQFDIGVEGAILNNSSGNVQTQLGGWVQGNPWLAGGTASTILNEVNSVDPSILNGFLEVAGDRAQVIVANPSGITCTDCGFINASGITLTTGTPNVASGNLMDYRVEGGSVTIDGTNGLESGSADYTDIIARSVALNSAIWANELRIITGTNTVSADTETVTENASSLPSIQYSVDVSALGGMYAGKIKLVGTEDGVGVRNAGTTSASSGGLVLTADGRLVNAGTLQSESANVTVNTSASVENTGSILAGTELAIDAGTTLQNDGTLVATSSLRATAATNFDNRGTINSVDTQLNAATLNNLGTGSIFGDTIGIAATTLSNLSETGQAPVIAARQSLDIGVGTLTNRDQALVFSLGGMSLGGALDASRKAMGQGGTLNNESATIEALGNLALNFGAINNKNLSFATDTVVTNLGTTEEYKLNAGDVFRASDTVTRYAPDEIEISYCQANCIEVLATGDKSDAYTHYTYQTTVTEDVLVSSDPGQIMAGGNLEVTANTLNNDKSQIIAGGDLTANVGTLTNTSIDGQKIIEDIGTATSWWRIREKGIDRPGSSTVAYQPPPVVETISLASASFIGNSTPNATGTSVAALDNSLFAADVSAPNGFIIETNPVFTNYNSWLNSSYILNAFSVDPDSVQKRLGDGFYEQRLLRDQIAELTGRRFLEGYNNDEEQFRALMDSGIAYARAYDISPGVALSPLQMASLTTDLVWLVSETVTLPDGTLEEVLVPRFYAAADRSTDVVSDGLIASDDALLLSLEGDLNNFGSLTGGQFASITGENINNNGGQIGSERVELAARTDVNNEGGTIRAEDDITIAAGRDINVSSTTNTQSNDTGSRTNIGQVGSVEVNGEDGTLTLEAGRDINLDAANIESEGNATVTAERDINLGTVETNADNQVTWDRDNYSREFSSAEVGTNLQTEGDLTLQAGRDLDAVAANVNSADGTLRMTAQEDVTIAAGENVTGLDEASKHKSKGFLSSRTITTKTDIEIKNAQGSSFGGKEVEITAGNDVTIEGSTVLADEDVTVNAEGDVDILSAQRTIEEENFRQDKKSGIFSSGGFGFTLGKRVETSDTDQTRVQQQSSTIGSLSGDVEIEAKDALTIAGSDILTQDGDITLQGSEVNLEARNDTVTLQDIQKFEQSGLTVSIGGGVIDTINTVTNSAERIEQVEDERLKALHAWRIGRAVQDLPEQIQDLQSATSPGDAGLSLNIGIGKTESTTTREFESATALGSSVLAEGDVTITATGENATENSGDITSNGTLIRGEEITLTAEDELNLRSALNTETDDTTSESKSFGIGITIGQGGVGVNVNASQSRGVINQTDDRYLETLIEGEDKVTLNSGADTTLEGAQVKADQVTANVGGDLNIISQQDIETYKNRQESSGINLTVGPGGVSGGINASELNADANYRSVQEQSGVFAGEEGFEVNVGGNTDLVGGAIVSEADPEKNSFSTDTLSVSEIKNTTEFDIETKSVGINIGGPNPVGLSGGFAEDSGSAQTTTYSAISEGNLEVRSDPDADLSPNLLRARQQAHTVLERIFDPETDIQALQEQAEAVQLFAEEGFKVVGDLYEPSEQARAEAEAARDLYERGEASIDLVLELEARALELESGLPNKAIAHAIVGGLTAALGGGNFLQGALAAGASEALAKQLDEGIKDPLARNLISALIGGALGGEQGAIIAGTAEQFNRQLHISEIQQIERNAEEFAQQINLCADAQNCTEKEIALAAGLLTKQALRQVDLTFSQQFEENAVAREFLESLRWQFGNVPESVIEILGADGRYVTFAAEGEVFEDHLYGIHNVYQLEDAYSKVLSASQIDTLKILNVVHTGAALRTFTGVTNGFTDTVEGVMDLAVLIATDPGQMADIAEAIYNNPELLVDGVIEPFKERYEAGDIAGAIGYALPAVVEVIAGSKGAVAGAKAGTEATKAAAQKIRDAVTGLKATNSGTPYPNLARPTASTPANTILGDLDELGRPTGVVSTITPNSLGTGTPANPSIRPPGFEGAASNHARGHLLARILGGAGDDARNLVTLFQRNANHPNMSSFERQVHAAVRNGETVSFRAIPVYTGNNPMPTGVTLTARGSNGFDLDVSIPNVNGLQ